MMLLFSLQYDGPLTLSWRFEKQSHSERSNLHQEEPWRPTTEVFIVFNSLGAMQIDVCCWMHGCTFDIVYFRRLCWRDKGCSTFSLLAAEYEPRSEKIGYWVANSHGMVCMYHEHMFKILSKWLNAYRYQDWLELQWWMNCLKRLHWRLVRRSHVPPATYVEHKEAQFFSEQMLWSLCSLEKELREDGWIMYCDYMSKNTMDLQVAQS